MGKTTKTKQYFSKCFEKKLLLQKAIIGASAFVLVLTLCLSFYLWLKDKQPGVVGEPNNFWYIQIIWNPGIGFGGLLGNYVAIYVIQSIMFVLLLSIFFLLTHDKITSSFIALATFGGLFNLIQRGASGTNEVLDYFRFGFWDSFPIFNWADMFVVIGIFGFVISYITLLIMQTVKENGKH